MRKYTLSLALAIALPIVLCAQTDSSRYDIGWLTLNKNFTQHLTIRGEDLEKMPFVNLSDAIAAWLYGAYTTMGTLAYVVDGDPVTDVNLYPIYDIEDVTLVEQAAGAAAYGSTQQQLVVIRTRRGKGKGGIRVAAQAGPVNRNGNGMSSFTNVYHQYYIGAYRNTDKVSLGASADWVRDVFPIGSSPFTHEITPDNLQRWRLNGHLTWKPSKGNTVDFGIGYAPQVMADAFDSIDGAQALEMWRSESHSHLLIPRLSWHLDLLPGLKNDLQTQFIASSVRSTLHVVDNPQGMNILQVADTTVFKANQWMLSDRIGYDWSGGGWHIHPALHLLYEHIEERSAYAYAYFSGATPSGPIITQLPLGPLREQDASLFVVTPSVDIGLGRGVDLLAGTQLNLSPGRDTGSRSVLPFVSVGIDVLHLGKTEGGSSLKLFGSYAQRSMVFLDDFSTADFSGGGGAYTISDLDKERTVPLISDTLLVRIVYPHTYWTWGAGGAFATADGRLELQYSLERRLFSTEGQYGSVSASTTTSLVFLQSFTSTLHHFDLRWKVLDEKEMRWLMGFNVSLLKNMAYYLPSPPGYFGSIFYAFKSTPPIGEISPSPSSWTGGFVNRWQLGDFTGGLDILYHFGENPPPPFGSAPTGVKLNSVLLPNVYAGYRWRVGAGELELFMESRGLARSKSSSLLDDRRYYTMGGSYSL
jgi:hypothetical protein